MTGGATGIRSMRPRRPDEPAWLSHAFTLLVSMLTSSSESSETALSSFGRDGVQFMAQVSGALCWLCVWPLLFMICALGLWETNRRLVADNLSSFESFPWVCVSPTRLRRTLKNPSAFKCPCPQHSYASFSDTTTSRHLCAVRSGPR